MKTDDLPYFILLMFVFGICLMLYGLSGIKIRQIVIRFKDEDFL